MSLKEHQSFRFNQRLPDLSHPGKTFPPRIPSFKFCHLDSLAYILSTCFQLRAPLDESLANPSRQASSAGVSTSSSSVGGSNGTILEIRLTLRTLVYSSGRIHEGVILV